jgi:transposase
MITSGNSFKLPLCYVFLEDTKYMTILTRQERERLVLELYYNQGKTYREIAKAARISPRDIGIILNKVIEEKVEGSKEEQGNINSKNHNQENKQHLSISAQAYKLFSDRKTPLEVAIALNLGESEATKFYKEYWKLKQLHNLNIVYEETKGDIKPFLKLYKLAKAKGMSVKQVVNLLAIANNDLSSIEERFKRLRNDTSILGFRKHTLERNLYQLNNQIATTANLLNSFHMSCKRERIEIENLYNERAKLESVVTEFKNNNEEYLDKIKQTAEEKVKDVLNERKILLQLATASVIESLRINPELCNFALYNISNSTATTYGSNYLSLMLLGRQQQHQQQSFNDIYTALILEEAEKLYNKLMTELTNSFITAAAAAMRTMSSLPLPLSSSNNGQKLNYENDTYQTKETRCNNNQPQIYNGNQEQANE